MRGICASDYDLERDAARARVGAERRGGELLRDTNLKEAKKENPPGEMVG